MSIPVMLLFAGMFIMITILAIMFLLHLRDHEKEQMEAEEFAEFLFERLQIERDNDAD